MGFMCVESEQTFRSASEHRCAGGDSSVVMHGLDGEAGHACPEGILDFRSGLARACVHQLGTCETGFECRCQFTLRADLGMATGQPQ